INKLYLNNLLLLEASIDLLNVTYAHKGIWICFLNNLTNVIHIVTIDDRDQNSLFNMAICTFSIMQNSYPAVHPALNTIDNMLGMLSYNHYLHLLVLRIDSIDYSAIDKNC